MNSRLTRIGTLCGAAVVATILSACSEGGSTEPSQVVARVNDAEVTASQLRIALAAAGETAPTAEATRQALEGLINEQLLVDAALSNKLDRDPTVVQTLESARRQVLARAYLERMVFPKGEISEEEQAAYYKAQPALFEKRRVYHLTAYTVPSDALTEELVKKLDEASTVDAVAAVLEAQGVVHESQTLTRAAEQLPLEQLPQFTAAEVGDVVIDSAPGGETALMLITGIQPSPIAFENAKPILQAYLTSQRNAQALEAHLAQVRAAATITHMDASLQPLTQQAPTPVATDDAAQESRVGSGAAVLN